MSYIEALYKKQDRINRKIALLEEDKAKLELSLKEETTRINYPTYIFQHPLEYAKKQLELKPTRDKIKELAASLAALSRKSENLQKHAERIHEIKRKIAPYKRLLMSALIFLIDLLLILFFLAIT